MLSFIGFVESEGRAMQDAAQGRWPDKEGVAEPNSQLRLKAALPLSKWGYQGHPFASWPNTHGASPSKPFVFSWSKLPSLKSDTYFDPWKYT